MKRSLVGVLLVGALLTINSTATAADAKDVAIRQDRKQIEGTWRISALEVNGKRASAEDAKQLTVVNRPDGSWTLFSADKEICQGSSSLDPLQKPKTIDFTPAMVHHGKAAAVVAQRQGALDAAYLAHSERFVRKPPTAPKPPTAVWINPPVFTPNGQENKPVLVTSKLH